MTMNVVRIHITLGTSKALRNSKSSRPLPARRTPTAPLPGVHTAATTAAAWTAGCCGAKRKRRGVGF